MRETLLGAFSKAFALLIKGENTSGPCLFYTFTALKTGMVAGAVAAL
jgi:hypothetical protein